MGQGANNGNGGNCSNVMNLGAGCGRTTVATSTPQLYQYGQYKGLLGPQKQFPHH